MTRRGRFIWMLSMGLMSVLILLSLIAVAQQAPRTKDQQSLDKSLIQAVRKHDAKQVRALLARGADPNARDMTAKPDRNGTGQPPITKEPPTALLVVFDNATSWTRSGQSELAIRRRQDPVEIVQALLDKGANPNVLDYDNRFPLLMAVQNLYADSARLLLQHGAKVNQTWVHGVTPLGVAANNKDVTTVKLLMDNGADDTVRSVSDDPRHPLSEDVKELLKQTN